MLVSEWITHKLIIKVRAFCLSENPLLAPGNVLPDEGIAWKNISPVEAIIAIAMQLSNLTDMQDLLSS